MIQSNDVEMVKLGAAVFTTLVKRKYWKEVLVIISPKYPFVLYYKTIKVIDENPIFFSAGYIHCVLEAKKVLREIHDEQAFKRKKELEKYNSR